jgi:hypothetical protein
VPLGPGDPLPPSPVNTLRRALVRKVFTALSDIENLSRALL